MEKAFARQKKHPKSDKQQHHNKENERNNSLFERLNCLLWNKLLRQAYRQKIKYSVPINLKITTPIGLPCAANQRVSEALSTCLLGLRRYASNQRWYSKQAAEKELWSRTKGERTHALYHTKGMPAGVLPCRPLLLNICMTSTKNRLRRFSDR